MRNALTSLEQLIAFGDGAVTMEVAERMLGAVDSTDLADIVRTIGVRDAAACFRWVAEYVETGADMAQFVANLAEHMRNMYVMAVAGPEVVLDVSETTRRELIQELPLFGVDRLARLLGVLGDVAGELKTSTNPRLTFEIALTRMVRPDADVTLEALAERVETLERQLAGASVVAAAAPASAGVPVAAPAPVSAAAPAAVVSAAVAPAGASPVGGDLGRPSAPAGSAPCDSPSASLAEGRPRSAPTEEVVPAAAPAAATSAAVAPAPDDDRPPYDDYVPYDDADIPFEDPFASRGASPQGAATFPAPSVSANASPAASSEVPPWEEAPQVPAPSGATPQAPASAPAPSPAPSMAAPSASALPPEPDAVSGPSPNPVEEPDLAASLAFGFGDGVNFEEVV